MPRIRKSLSVNGARFHTCRSTGGKRNTYVYKKLLNYWLESQAMYKDTLPSFLVPSIDQELIRETTTWTRRIFWLFRLEIVELMKWLLYWWLHQPRLPCPSSILLKEILTMVKTSKATKPESLTTINKCGRARLRKSSQDIIRCINRPYPWPYLVYLDPLRPRRLWCRLSRSHWSVAGTFRLVAPSATPGRAACSQSRG